MEDPDDRSKRNWRESRQQIKEYKWHRDIHAGYFTDISVKSVVKYAYTLVMALMVFVHWLLDALMIKNIHHFKVQVNNEVLNNVTTCTVTPLIGNENSESCSQLVHSLNSMLIAYIIFTGVTVTMSFYDFWVAYKVVVSDDVSDSFVNPTAFQWHSITHFSRFCFFMDVGNRTTILDSFVIFLYHNLYSLKQFIPDIPMFIIAYLYSGYSGQFKQFENVASSYAKAGFLGIRFIMALFCIICYPFVRFCFVRGPLLKYASFRVDKLIELTLWPQNQGKQALNEKTGADVGAPTVPSPSNPQPPPPSIDPAYPPPPNPSYDPQPQYPPQYPPPGYPQGYPPADPNYPPSLIPPPTVDQYGNPIPSLTVDQYGNPIPYGYQSAYNAQPYGGQPGYYP